MDGPSGRLAFGIPELDQHLGGGLLPGTLTVLAGAAGIGKTQLGLHFAEAGGAQEGRRGIVFDMTARGDSQSHEEYAERLFAWRMQAMDTGRPRDATALWDHGHAIGDYLEIFERSGRRVTRRDLEFEDWQVWKKELAQKLQSCIYFFYGNFVRGVRRAVVDGLEPVDRPSDSVQFELFDYIYHQILRKDARWVARDLLREAFRENQGQVEAQTYDPGEIGCLLVYTTREVLLDELMFRPLDEGDVFANANTVILLGRTRRGESSERGMFIAKHRRSYCHEGVIRYEVGPGGVALTG